MSLSHMIARRLSVPAGLAFALAVLLLVPEPAAAQPPGRQGRIPPDARGYQTTQILQQRMRQRSRQQQARAVPATPPARYQATATARVAPAAPVQVVVTVPATPTPSAPAPAYVNVRGPDGQLRQFPVAAGPGVIRTREIIVRPGQSATVQVVGSPGAGK